jgi:hypothetical protein
MEEPRTPEPTPIAEIVSGAVTPATTDRTALMTLSARCWPGRDDRTVPAGRHWIRAWGPRPMTAIPHDCGSASQRCGFCN